MSGSRPPTGSRATGELYVNFADRQIGYIDPSQAPVDLLPITAFMTASAYAAGAYVIYQGQLYQARAAVPAGTFNPAQWTTVGGSITVAASAPANPFQGQLWWDSVSGQLFVFYDDGNSQQWVVAINERGSYLAISGGNLTGAISGPGNGGAVLSQNDPPAGDNSKALATTGWVQSTLAGRQNRNRIINGNFLIDQYNNFAIATCVNQACVCDRWRYWGQQAGVLRSVVSDDPAVGDYLWFVVNTPATIGADDTFCVIQTVEAGMLIDLGWGSSFAKPVTLSFWAWALTPGTYSGAVRNDTALRVFAFGYTIAAAQTWQKFSFTIPGDTAGTWVVTGAGAGLAVVFDLGSGANQRIAAGAWTATVNGAVGVTGASSIVSQSGGQLKLAQIQFELGTQATPFDWRPNGEVLALCQRYHQTGTIYVSFGITNPIASYGQTGTFPFPVMMRTTPTMTSANWQQSNCYGSYVTAQDTAVFIHSYYLSGGNGVMSSGVWYADAEL